MSISGISTMCTTALPNLLTGDFGTCANLLGLLPLASGSGSTDLVDSLGQYLGGLCTSEPCSDSTIANATAVISQGCATDIQSGDTTALGLYALVQNFNGFRSLLCTQYTGNGSYCLIDIIESYQNSTGNTVSLDVSALTSGLPDADPSIYCTDCGKAFITESLALAQNITAGFANATSGTGTATTSAAASTGTSSLDTSAAEAQLNQTLTAACGANFLDGQIPDTVTVPGRNGTAAAATTALSSAAAVTTALSSAAAATTS